MSTILAQFIGRHDNTVTSYAFRYATCLDTATLSQATPTLSFDVRSQHRHLLSFTEIKHIVTVGVATKTIT